MKNTISPAKQQAVNRQDCDQVISHRKRGVRGNHPFSHYKPAFPLSTELSRRIGGHGGSDFYTMHYFLQKILGRPEGKHAIDVYQAMDMTLPGLVSQQSILEGGRWVDVPDPRDW